ncbi:MAG: pyridoxal phosphate-dependent aminotransferase [Myxococcales bacterium]|nr:pyridoxal phosphate-dependent aminotransferase [Myxococcales bacterium]MCB9731089.1 pyridoxal phosphate-dependent aminotransferase [Deltaproteobacteria bacterium]
MPRFPGTSHTNATLSATVFSRFAQRLKDLRGVTTYPLHVGDTWREPLEAARAEAQRTAETPHLHTYSPVQGEPALVAAAVRKVKARTGVDLDPADVQVTVGATGGLSVVCQALLDPGDEVLLPAPFWPLIRGIIASRGAVPVQVPLMDRLAAGRDAVDVEAALEAAVTARTVAIYVNSPHNPTGVVLDDAAAAAIARVAARHDLWVLCDEVYEDLFHGAAAPTPLWTRPDLRPRAIVVHSLSKAYGLAGARVGYAHGPAEAMAAIRAVHTFQAYGTAKPMQLGAARALDDGAAWLAETRAAYRDAAAATAAAFGAPAPAGGTFLFADVRDLVGGDDATPLLLALLERGVILTPGGACGDAYGGFVRVCYTSVHPGELASALAIVREVVADLRAGGPTA